MEAESAAQLPLPGELWQAGESGGELPGAVRQAGECGDELPGAVRQAGECGDELPGAVRQESAVVHCRARYGRQAITVTGAIPLAEAGARPLLLRKVCNRLSL